MNKLAGAAQSKLHSPSLLLPSFTEAGPESTVIRTRQEQEPRCQAETRRASALRYKKVQLGNGPNHRFGTAEQGWAAAFA